MLCLTFKTHVQGGEDRHISCVSYGTPLRTAIDNYNQQLADPFRIKQLFNPLGQVIPPQIWTIPVRENLTFYLD